MVRRNSIIAMAVLAFGIACMSSAEAGGRRKPPAPPGTTRTIVNSTASDWFVFVYSGDMFKRATTIGDAIKQGAKVVSANGGKAVFKVSPGGGFIPNLPSARYDHIFIVKASLATDHSAVIQQNFGRGNFAEATYTGVPNGKNVTITITQTGSDTPEFTPPGDYD